MAVPLQALPTEPSSFLVLVLFFTNSKMFGKRMRDLFFTQDQDDPHQGLCRCGTKSREAGTGSTILVGYLREKRSNDYKAALGGSGAQ